MSHLKAVQVWKAYSDKKVVQRNVEIQRAEKIAEQVMQGSPLLTFYQGVTLSSPTEEYALVLGPVYA